MGVFAKRQQTTARRRLAAVALTAALASGVCAPAGAAQVIPAGGAAFVYNGLYDLACTDLTINGTLDTGSGTYVKVRNISIGPGGVLQGNGSISYSGTLSNIGTLRPGVTLVVDSACGTPPVQQIPTTSQWTLIALAGLLLCLASVKINGNGALRRRRVSRGASK